MGLGVARAVDATLSAPAEAIAALLRSSSKHWLADAQVRAPDGAVADGLLWPQRAWTLPLQRRRTKAGW